MCQKAKENNKGPSDPVIVIKDGIW